MNPLVSGALSCDGAHAQATGQPIVVGEFGGTLAGRDRAWQEEAVRYMGEKGFGFFYFGLQPDRRARR